MQKGTISVYPEVRESGEGLALAPWQYMQHFRGTLLDGKLLIWMNGGILDVIEDRYLAVSDGHRCEWQRLSGSSDTEGETGMATVCRTPWADPQKRWLLAWSGSYRRVGMQSPYRVWVGLATAPAPEGPWTCHSEMIRSQRLVTVPPPPFDWWPPGVWASSLLAVGDRVFLLDHDSGVPQNGTRPRHALHEIMPDLTSRVVGGVKLSDEIDRSWIFDVALKADGTLLCLTGDSSHNIDPLPVAEYAAPAWNPDAVCIAARTGRTWKLDGDPLPSDPGYVRTPEGGLVEPTTVLADWTSSVDPTARDWKGGWVSEHAEVARLLSVAPARPRAGEPAGITYEFAYVNDLSISVLLIEGTATVEWHGQKLTVPHDLLDDCVRKVEGGIACDVDMAVLFDGFDDPAVQQSIEAGADFAMTKVKGKCLVTAKRASGIGGIITPFVRDGRW